MALATLMIGWEQLHDDIFFVSSLHIPQKRTEGEYRISLHMSISSFHSINLLPTASCDAAS